MFLVRLISDLTHRMYADGVVCAVGAADDDWCVAKFSRLHILETDDLVLIGLRYWL